MKMTRLLSKIIVRVIQPAFCTSQAAGRGSINAQGHHGDNNNLDGDIDDDEDLLIAGRPTAGRAPSEDDNDDSDNDNFTTVKTPPVILLQCLLFVGLEVAAFLVPHFMDRSHDNNNNTDQRSEDDDIKNNNIDKTDNGDETLLPYFILLYSHGALWFVVVGFDRILWSQHRKVGGHERERERQTETERQRDRDRQNSTNNE